ncbi:M28 family peptidase [bacterium]|nr:M28 family peptidase [bacterium]
MKMRFSYFCFIVFILFISCNSGDEVYTFDGEAAYEYLLGQCNFGPRPPGSETHIQCLNYLVDHFQKYADKVEKQTFSHLGYNGQFIPMTNIIAKFNLDRKDRIVLLAHWDTRPWAEYSENEEDLETPIMGANDGASGVAILMQLAVMFNEKPPPVGVDIFLTDGEDYGMPGDIDNYLLGAKYYARNLRGQLPQCGILLDMIGDKDLQIYKEKYSVRYAPKIVERIWHIADSLGITEFKNSEKHTMIDDHLPLNEAGIKTVNIIDFDYPYWHTQKDTPDKCSPESLAKVGTVLANFVYTYKSR